MAEYFHHKGMTVSTDGIRQIDEIRQRPEGGPPHKDAGIIIYEDGFQIDTTLEFVVELVKILPKRKAGDMPF